MESLDGTEWDVIIYGTDLTQSLLALYDARVLVQARLRLTD